MSEPLTGPVPDAPAGPVTADRVATALARVRARIAGAGGDPDRIRVVAVTKGFGAEAVQAAAAAGIDDVGESYAQELLAKAGAVAGARWHFVGRVQRNKVAAIAPVVHLWHGVDRPAVGEAIAHRAPGAGVLVQVNVSGEPHKGGCAMDDTEALVQRCAALGLDVRGLMGLGPAGAAEAARPGFRWLAAAARRLGLPEVSMGMTGDLEVAVEEGTTMVRIGRALFGERPRRAGSATVGSRAGGD